jgi:hypothetical protein
VFDCLDYSHLDGWTPIAIHRGAAPSVEWADMRASAFDTTSFSRTVDDWRGNAGPATIHTGLDALTALDDRPSLDPDLIIAHPSRCGSTLLARLAAARDDAVLLSEPGILHQLLTLDLVQPLDQPVARILRQAVRALGRIRFGWERRYVLKLNSQTTRFLPAVRAAFPATPIVWLQRRPAEIIQSNIRGPARGWAPPCDPAAWALQRVTLAFLAATAFVDHNVHVLDYRDLPDAAWARVAGLMGIDPDAADLARMRALAAVDARSGKPFMAELPTPLPDAVDAIVRGTLDPMYHALALRGSAG